MMKTLIVMLVGLFSGFIACYMMQPSFGGNHEVKPEQVDNNVKPVSHQYNHDEEGTRLQTLEMMDIEDYISTEGNSAELFVSENMCKIRVNIVGETSYRYRTFYFKNSQPIYAMQSLYNYPNGGLSNMDSPDAFKEELYSDEILNPDSSIVIQEFNTLLSRFSPHYLKKC